MNTKALRQKILDLAIHGKLVPQDPNDEPASVLLERIRAEKERLIKEGKIKKPKKCKAACDKPHYPYELPKGWVWTTVGELFTLQAGKNITSNNISPTQNAEYKYPCFGGNGIRGYVASSNRSGNYPIIGRQGALCGNVNLANGEFYATEHAVVVDYYCETDFMWCYYTLEALNLNQYATATAQPGLAVNIINEVSIPLPPYKEQKVISEAISYWLSLIDTIGNSKEQLLIAIGQAKSQILDLAIHGKLVPQDPNDEPANELLKRINTKVKITCDNPHYQNLPSGWTIIKVGNAAEYINGRAFKPEEWKSKGLPIIRIQNLNDVNAPYNRSTTEYESKYLIQNGNLLFAWAASLGTYIWQGNNAWLNQHIFKVIPHSFIDKEYLYYTFQAMISEFYKNSHGSGMVHITKKQFEEVILLLPPLSEQHRIVKRLKILFAMLDNISDCL